MVNLICISTSETSAITQRRGIERASPKPVIRILLNQNLTFLSWVHLDPLKFPVRFGRQLDPDRVGGAHLATP